VIQDSEATLAETPASVVTLPAAVAKEAIADTEATLAETPASVVTLPAAVAKEAIADTEATLAETPASVVTLPAAVAKEAIADSAETRAETQDMVEVTLATAEPHQEVLQAAMVYVLPSTSSLDIFLRVDGQLPLPHNR
jgi:hypothetical protein